MAVPSPVAPQGVTTHGCCSPKATWSWGEPAVPDVPKDGALQTTPVCAPDWEYLAGFSELGDEIRGMRAGSSAGSPPEPEIKGCLQCLPSRKWWKSSFGRFSCALGWPSNGWGLGFVLFCRQAGMDQESMEQIKNQCPLV